MQAVFLGTGTSHGIPVIGCSCAVCRSPLPQNRRRRCSLYVQAGGLHLLFDTSPDLRDQVLAFGVERVDAVFLTHAHADHLFGLDDLRRFSEMQQMHIPVHAAPDTLRQAQAIFSYTGNASHSFGAVPRVRFTEMEGPVLLGECVRVVPVPVFHGTDRVYGYTVEHEGARLGYIPDCSAIPPESRPLLQRLDVMILDGLRPEPHATHFSIPECIEQLRQIGAKRSYLTHLTHHSEHFALQAALPQGIDVPYDGLSLRTDLF